MTPASILVVEDDRIVARDIQQCLTKFGYSVAGVTAQGAEAVRLALDLRPDLVLMDIRLEGPLDGVEAAEQIRSRCHIPVVYLTAYADEETLRRARVTEPFGYLLKPFEDRELRTVIEMALYKHAAERKLRESERRYAITLSSIGDGVIATDGGGRVTFVNPVAEALTGWPQAQAAGLPLPEVFPILQEASREPVEGPVAKVLRQGTVVGLGNHTILVGRDGREVPIDDCGAPIRDDNGAIVGVVLVFHDVTESRRAEAALRESNDLVRLLLDSTAEAIYGLDLEGRCTFCNAACVRLLGYQGPHDLLGKNMHALIHHTRADGTPYPEPDCRIYQAFRRGEGMHGDDEVVWRSDGTGFPAEFWSYPVHRAGALVGAVVTFIDISERIRAEESLRQAEQKYRGIVDNAVDGIFQSTPGGRFLTVNPALARILGYSSPGELTARVQDIARQLYGDPERRDEYARVLEGRGTVQGFECQFFRKDGSKVWVSLSTRAVRGPDGRTLYYEGIVDEITERKRLEEQLRQSQKMEAIGQLAGGVAHDFNNLLTVITGYCDILLNDLRFEDPSRPSIDEIRRAGERAAALTRQLLAFSRKQLVAPQVLDLNALVRDMQKMLRRLIGEHISLRTALDPAAGLVKADPGQLEQVVLNLVVNARDAMPRGGGAGHRDGNHGVARPQRPGRPGGPAAPLREAHGARHRPRHDPGGHGPHL
jgi:PAS domain S-box-containing protein